MRRSSRSTSQTAATASPDPVEITDLDTRIGSLVGAGPDDIHIGGMAVHPDTQAVYLSVTRGQRVGRRSTAGPDRGRADRRG